MSDDDGYLLDNRQAEAGSRFDALARLLDPVTFRHLDAGWRFRVLMAQRGADLAFGRTLPRLLRDAGLLDVEADAYFPVASPACTALEAATVRQVRDRLVAAGLATDAEIDRHLATVATGRMDLATSPLISVWGRRPD